MAAAARRCYTIKELSKPVQIGAAMKLSRVVGELIRLGDASHAYWDHELPKHHPHYPVVRAGEASVPPPPEDARFKRCSAALRTISSTPSHSLRTWARATFSADHLQTAFQTMKETLPNKELAIAQIMAEKSLAEYLTDAMEEIRNREIDLDHLEFAGSCAGELTRRLMEFRCALERLLRATNRAFERCR